MHSKLFFGFLLLLSNRLIAQETAVGSPIEAWELNHPSGNESWSNANFVYANDLFYANSSATILAFNADTSHYMISEDYNFNIPSGATIQGVEVTVIKSAANVFGFFNVRDETISLVLDSNLFGSNKANTSNWTLLDQVVTYGGPADTWGLTLTPAIINDPTFGVSVSAQFDGLLATVGSATLDAFVGYISMEVSYSNPLPIELKSFSGLSTALGNEIYWSTISEVNNDYFSVEKSIDAKNWSLLDTLSGAGNSNRELKYSIVDPDDKSSNYYRLKQTDYNGEFEYFDPIYLKKKANKLDDFEITHNLYDNSICIKSKNSLKKIYIYNSLGSLESNVVISSLESICKYMFKSKKAFKYLFVEDEFGNKIKKRIGLKI